jgi:hypothetical protein
MQGGSDRRLQGFQIQAGPLAAILKDHPQQLAYFARDFLLDGFRYESREGEESAAR